MSKQGEHGVLTKEILEHMIEPTSFYRVVFKAIPQLQNLQFRIKRIAELQEYTERTILNMPEDIKIQLEDMLEHINKIETSLKEEYASLIYLKIEEDMECLQKK